jgi:hypothetical protein
LTPEYFYPGAQLQISGRKLSISRVRRRPCEAGWIRTPHSPWIHNDTNLATPPDQLLFGSGTIEIGDAPPMGFIEIRAGAARFKPIVNLKVVFGFLFAVVALFLVAFKARRE